MSDSITIVFPVRGGRIGEAVLPWVSGRTLKQYFRLPELAPYHLTGLRMRHTMLNHVTRKRLRLGSTPQPGDVIHITKR